jgi:hypothetical protein
MQKYINLHILYKVKIWFFTKTYIKTLLRDKLARNTEKDGNYSVVLTRKQREKINQEKVKLSYLVSIGLKYHCGEIIDEKTIRLVQKISEQASEINRLNEKVRKLLRSGKNEKI